MQKIKVNTITIVPLFAIITAVCSQIVIPLPFTPVPINLGNFAVFLTGALLNKRDSFLSQLVYISLGILGLPVFSRFGSGIGIIFGPTGGFILSYCVMAFVISLLIEKLPNNFIFYIFSMIAALLICYLFGCVGFILYSGCNFITALVSTVFPFIVFDIAKILLASSIAVKLRKYLVL